MSSNTQARYIARERDRTVTFSLKTRQVNPCASQQGSHP
jgi:hypothetical protein